MNCVRRNEAAPREIAEGVTRYLISTDSLMMVAFEFTNGPSRGRIAHHTHPHEQISYVLSGEIAYFVGDEKTVLKSGDMIAIPSNTPHTIQLISKTAKLIDAFHPIREDFLK